MNTIGWAIFVVGMSFNLDMTKMLTGKEMSDGGQTIAGCTIIFGFIMMIVSTVRS